jgi:hypothetical protein
MEAGVERGFVGVGAFLCMRGKEVELELVSSVNIPLYEPRKLPYCNPQHVPQATKRISIVQ